MRPHLEDQMLFGNAPISPAELLRIVTSEVPTRAKSDRKTDWTQAVKEVICELGEQRGFKTYASIHLGSEKHEEWLLDVVWWTTSGGMQLGVESEWGKVEHVLDDFEKLMSVKSPLKLMVFSSGETLLSENHIVQKLREYLTDFDQNVKDEIYLLVDFTGGGHQCYECRVPHDGRLKENEVEFSHVKDLSGPDVIQKGTTA
jgi:hypothetical protein